MGTPATLVTGATGSVGRRVVARLCALGVPVRAASRHSATRFDWDDEETWEPALRGVDRLFLMAPDGVPVAAGFVELAARRVEHVVLLSSRAIEALGDGRLLAAEELVTTCGTGWTILRCDWFDQNFDEGPFREAVLGGELAVPVGDARQTFVDLADVAAVAARVLTGDGHLERTYEVTGPAAISFADACAVVGNAIGRRVRFHGDPGRYRRDQTALGRPAEEVEQEIAAFAALAALGDAEPSETVARLTGRPARPFEAYVAEAAASDRWREPAGRSTR